MKRNTGIDHVRIVNFHHHLSTYNTFLGFPLDKSKSNDYDIELDIGGINSQRDYGKNRDFRLGTREGLPPYEPPQHFKFDVDMASGKPVVTPIGRTRV